jgi:hypothetical protein
MPRDDRATSSPPEALAMAFSCCRAFSDVHESWMHRHWKTFRIGGGDFTYSLQFGSSQAWAAVVAPPVAAAAIAASAWSIVNDAAFCLGGNSLNVATNWLTIGCAPSTM